MKKALTIDEQIQRLVDHNMTIADKEAAKAFLTNVGYYRFGFYAFPFEKRFPKLKKRDHMLVEGTTFEDVVDLYRFDCQLRNLLSYYLNVIEVSMRTVINHTVSLHYIDNPTWFVDSEAVTPQYIAQFDHTVYNTIRKNPAIEYHHEKHPEDKYAPAWKVFEFMTFGNLNLLFLSLKNSELQDSIARHYGCTYKPFANYCEMFRVIRNKCAHNNCVYRFTLSTGLAAEPAGIKREESSNLAGVIKLIKYFLNTISPQELHNMERQLAALLNEKRSENANKVIRRCTKLTFEGKSRSFAHFFQRKALQFLNLFLPLQCESSARRA